METIAGIFVAREEAVEAAQQLQNLGFKSENLILLSPGAGTEQVAAVPTEDAEQPGTGKALGSVVGGAAGLSAGAVIGSLLLPGIGPVLAVTFGAAAAGVGGAIFGGIAGRAFEEILTRGVPKDEIFFYEDALRKGHTVLIGLSDKRDNIEAAREALRRSGAETIDAAREQWWIGIRDAEEAEYPDRDHFRSEEAIYRRGFAAALEPEMRGRSFDEAAAYLKRNHPVYYAEISFRRGFERGQIYYQYQVKTFRSVE